jgi:hypothetical protein
MKIITADAETYLADDYTLKKMTTEAYIRDPRFECHGWAVRHHDGRMSWESPRGFKELCEAWDAEGVAMLCHHAHFDGLIMSHHYGYKPKLWLDTLSMGRVCFGPDKSLGLEALARHFDLAPKSVPYELFRGKHWHELPPAHRQAVADGAMHDCELTWQCAQYMLAGGHPAVPYPFPPSELLVVDATVRMFTEPTLVGDVDLIAAAWVAEEKARQDLFAELGVTAADLRKDDVFAAMLTTLGVDPAIKTTVNGNEKYAFAKSDWFMQDLATHDDERVALLAEARLKAQSSIYQTRAERLGWAATRGPLPVYLSYAAAHTRRWGGGDKCVTGDTRILTLDVLGELNYKSIVDVLGDDLVWDGQEFVTHGGVIFQGYAEVMTYEGITATPNHKVYTETGTACTLAQAADAGARIMVCREPTCWEVDSARRSRL